MTSPVREHNAVLERMPAAIGVALLTAVLAASPGNACSFFVIHDGTRVLAGNNEDFHDPDTWVWYVPAEKTKDGVVYFGYGNRFPQGGMNDQGLFFDGAATEKLPVRNSTDKKKLPLAKLLTAVARIAVNTNAGASRPGQLSSRRTSS